MSEERRGTIMIDSLGELARLTFSKDMQKGSGDMETLRAVNNYPGAVERICIIVRKLKEFRDKHGFEVVLTAHESIDKIYAKGGMMGKKGEPPPEPIAVKGLPGIPGNTGPAEIMKAADNVLRVKQSYNKLEWLARPESIGPGAGNWEVKDRFNATAIQNGYLPPSYAEIEKLALANELTKDAWNPPYLWVIYGPPGTRKTRSILTFPPPLYHFDIDGSQKALSGEIKNGLVTSKTYNSEEARDYGRFLQDLIGLLADPSELARVKKALGLS